VNYDGGLGEVKRSLPKESPSPAFRVSVDSTRVKVL
jgi:hypothetical protein